MKPLLYGAPLSPFVRKVRLLLELKEVSYDSKMIIPYATPEEYKSLNPLRRVPALTLGEHVFADSAVISHFLDAHYANKQLIPNDLFLRAHCEWLEKYADYELSALTTFTVFSQRILNRISGKPTDEGAVLDAVNNKLPPLFDYLESQLNGLFFINDEITLADISIASQLISYEHANESVSKDKWPKLARFYQNFTQHSVVEQIILSEKTMLNKILRS